MTIATTRTGIDMQDETPKARAKRMRQEVSARRRSRAVAKLTEPDVEPEDGDCLEQQVAGVRAAFRPQDRWQGWLVEQIAVHMIRIKRCARVEEKLRAWATYRAIEFWEDDQKAEVETIAARIVRDPARIVGKLKGTPAGIDWLLTRWRVLAKAEPTTWTDDQRTLAGRLTGNDPLLDVATPGFAAEMIATLESRRARVEEADEIARSLVESDMTDDVPNLARLRGYARSLQRQMIFYIDQFHMERPDGAANPERKPTFIAHDPVAPPSFLDETKPSPVAPTVAEVRIDETNPIASPQPATDKTKPFIKLAAALPTARHISTQVDSPAHSPRTDRPRRPDLAREAQRRQQAARRRAAMAELVGS